MYIHVYILINLNVLTLISSIPGSTTLIQLTMLQRITYMLTVAHFYALLLYAKVTNLLYAVLL